MEDHSTNTARRVFTEHAWGSIPHTHIWSPPQPNVTELGVNLNIAGYEKAKYYY